LAALPRTSARSQEAVTRATGACRARCLITRSCAAGRRRREDARAGQPARELPCAWWSDRQRGASATVW